MRKIYIIAAILAVSVLFAACSAKPVEKKAIKISASEAKEIMDKESDILIVDVREKEEYDSGHIENAVLFPLGSIDKDTAQELIPDKDKKVLVYCRSGARSANAAAKLAELGYTDVYDFGGIIDWSYDIVK